MDYARLYEYRHRRVDQASRSAVWEPIASHIHQLMRRPAVVLDPAAGRAEFINAVPAVERWAVDAQASLAAFVAEDVKCVVGDIFDVDLPPAYFDGIFVSNFLEHLYSIDAVQNFLVRMRTLLSPGGRIAVLGPNFKYTVREYFDFADHCLPLTHLSIAEHLHTAGFVVDEVVPRFIPYSFTGHLPADRRLTAAYLRLPLVWRVLGKQFLVVGTV